MGSMVDRPPGEVGLLTTDSTVDWLPADFLADLPSTESMVGRLHANFVVDY